MRLLIIEDELPIAYAIKKKLEPNHYTIDISSDGLEGFMLAKNNIYDLIILDVMLPNMDGFTILKQLREEKVNSKIIILSARSVLDDLLNGLNNGANDYVTKPFSMEELIARINIQLNDPTNSTLTFGDITLDIKESKLYSHDKMVELLCKELLILEYFLVNTNNILSKEQILNKVWGLDNKSESNNVEVYLSFIRRKLKALDSHVNIKSCRGLGYKLVFEDE